MLEDSILEFTLVDGRRVAVVGDEICSLEETAANGKPATCIVTRNSGMYFVIQPIAWIIDRMRKIQMGSMGDDV